MNIFNTVFTGEKEDELAANILKPAQFEVEQVVADKSIVLAPIGENYLTRTAQELNRVEISKEFSQQQDVLFVIVLLESEATLVKFPDWVTLVLVRDSHFSKSSNTLKNRLVKWGLSSILPNVRSSIYLDSDLVIVPKLKRILRLFKEIDRYGFVLTEHANSSSWIEEYEDIKKQKRFFTSEKLELQYLAYSKIKELNNYPVSNNTIVGRIHNSEMNRFGDAVIGELLRYSERDQLATVHAQHLTGFTPKMLTDGVFLHHGISKKINPKTVCFIENSSGAKYTHKIAFLYARYIRHFLSTKH